MSDELEPSHPDGMTRRRFLATTSTAAIAAAGVAPAKGTQDPRSSEVVAWGAEVKVGLKVNGRDYPQIVDVRTTLLDALREHVGLTGTKMGCDHGQCGACTIHLEGKRVLACLTLAVVADGRSVTTIEGLSSPAGQLHPMQQAFIDEDAFQCGYCTPGQIMSAVSCVIEGHADNDEDIREYMSGNLCRCSAYPNIVAAVRRGKANMRQ